MPHAVLCIALIISAIIWVQTKNHFTQVAEVRFSSREALVKSKIEGRMHQYDQVLRSGVALFNSSEEVSRSEWQQFIAACENQRWLPGIQCIGFSVPVAKQDVADFEESIRQEGFPGFKISPPGDRDDYTAIKFLEPFDWRNQRAFGYDMYSNPVRRAAMNRAALTGCPSISGKITLIQETDEDVQPGILCYLPLYAKGERLESPDQRKQALIGWVYAAFRCSDLMSNILGEHVEELTLQIFDSEESSENIIFSSHPAVPISSSSNRMRLSSVIPINVAGRIWKMRLEAQPEFLTASESFISPLVGVIGVLISVLLYAVLLLLSRQRERAIELAEQMTRGLKESERKTRSILENASEAILSVSEDGVISAANRVSQSVFEFPHSMTDESMDDFLVDETFRELTKRCQQTSGKIMTACRRASGEVFQCSVSIGEVTLDNELNYIVVVTDETERIVAAELLAEKNKQLVMASHSAGMAEVATGVLHNVGNVLNSVNVSTTILKEKLSASSITLLKKGADTLGQHESNIVEYLTENDRGKHFPKFIQQVTDKLISERDVELDEVESLVQCVEHIREIVAAQQSSASGQRIIESIQVATLIDSAIKMNESSMNRHEVQIVTEISELPTINSQQHSILQVLINLIKNAKEACYGRESKVVTVSAIEESGFVRVEVKDNGVGISPEQHKKLFQHGYTSKRDGHGFGLHAAAITATELGGSLSVHSDGVDQGATFTLRIPFSHT